MNKDDAREAAEFEAKAKKFREERSKAWAEYIDSNEGADALVDYFIDLMEQIDERRVIGFRGGQMMDAEKINYRMVGTQHRRTGHQCV